MLKINDKNNMLKLRMGANLSSEITTSQKKNLIINVSPEIEKKKAFIFVQNFEKGTIHINCFPGSRVLLGDCRQINLKIQATFQGSKVKIGARTSINEAKFWVQKGMITVGEDCMFSEEIHCYSDDEHSIMDLTGVVLNEKKNSINIEKYV